MIESDSPPEFWVNRPTLDNEFVWLKQAYTLLTRSRQLGSMSEYYIPMTEYDAFCRLMRYETDKQLLLVDVLTQVDHILLSERLDEQRKEMESKK